jgi:hypothetical protein
MLSRDLQSEILKISVAVGAIDNGPIGVQLVNEALLCTQEAFLPGLPQ